MGGRAFPSTLNGVSMDRNPAKSVREGLTGTGYSPKSAVSDFAPAFIRFLEAGGMFYRDGSGALGLCYVAAGRLIGFFEPIIKSWDCLGAIAVLQGAGLTTNDFLAGEGLWKGNPIIAGNTDVYIELRKLTGY
jgi:myo-inositol-1(or 4)-monophosphatase